MFASFLVILSLSNKEKIFSPFLELAFSFLGIFDVNSLEVTPYLYRRQFKKRRNL